MNRAGALLLYFMALTPFAGDVRAEQEVVLVAAAGSPLRDLNALELRKIFLGFQVMRDGNSVKGLLNTQDGALNRIFLQTVVAMSDKSYRRRMLSVAIRQGIPRAAEYDRPENLIKALSSQPYSVSYMWKDAALQSPEIKILKVLWHP